MLHFFQLFLLTQIILWQYVRSCGRSVPARARLGVTSQQPQSQPTHNQSLAFHCCMNSMADVPIDIGAKMDIDETAIDEGLYSRQL